MSLSSRYYGTESNRSEHRWISRICVVKVSKSVGVQLSGKKEKKTEREREMKRHIRVRAKLDVAMLPVFIAHKAPAEADSVLDRAEAEVDNTGLRVGG